MGKFKELELNQVRIEDLRIEDLFRQEFEIKERPSTQDTIELSECERFDDNLYVAAGFRPSELPWET